MRQPWRDFETLARIRDGERESKALPSRGRLGLRNSAHSLVKMLDPFRGEALLLAIERVTDGAKGDLRDVTAGLGLFRAVGLEDTARRTALQLMLLERRG